MLFVPVHFFIGRGDNRQNNSDTNNKIILNADKPVQKYFWRTKVG
jgi:hypothetical protein